MANYCSRDDVLYYAGVKSEKNDNRDQQVDGLLARVKGLIDSALGTWFDEQEKTFWIRPAHAEVGRIFMPARIMSITSVEEVGTALTTRDYIQGNDYLERHGAFWRWDYYDDGAAVYLPIKVVGRFGHRTIPDEINQMAAELCAILAGLKKRTFITGEGVERAVTMSTIPTYVQQQLNGKIWYDFTGQQLVYA